MTEPAHSALPEVVGERAQNQGVDLELRIGRDLLCLQGHFPNMPIVPGVAQVDWAVNFADRYLEAGLRAAVDFRVKFRSIIQPPISLMLELRIEGATPDTRRLGFTYRAADVVFSSGAIRLGPEP